MIAFFVKDYSSKHCPSKNLKDNNILSCSAAQIRMWKLGFPWPARSYGSVKPSCEEWRYSSVFFNFTALKVNNSSRGLVNEVFDVWRIFEDFCQRKRTFLWIDPSNSSEPRGHSLTYVHTIINNQINKRWISAASFSFLRKTIYRFVAIYNSLAGK